MHDLISYIIRLRDRTGHIVNSSSEDSGNETQGSSRVRLQPIVSSQPSYHEVPFPAPHHHELEFAFKYFSQYAGNGQEYISKFYSEEWVSRASHRSGAFGRKTQREIAAHSSASTATPSSAAAPTSVTTGSPNDRLFMESTNDIDIQEILKRNVKQQEILNLLQLRRDRIASKKEALQMAKDLGKPREEINKIQEQIYQMTLAEDFPQVRHSEDSEASRQMSSNSTATRLTPAFEMSTLAANSRIVSPPTQRTCLRASPNYPQEDESLYGFCQVDVPGDGNCGFHVMAIIFNIHFDRAESEKKDCVDLRDEICDLMLREACSIFLSKVRDLDWAPGVPGEEHKVYIEDEMKTEYGDVAKYCANMKKHGTCCGMNEFAAFVHHVGDDIEIKYHTTKAIEGSQPGRPEVYTLSRETVRPDRKTYHVLHKDGHDGRDGHFMFLVQRESERTLSPSADTIAVDR